MDAEAVVPVSVIIDGRTVWIEARQLGGEEEVAGRSFDFEDVTNSLAAIASQVGQAVRGLRPERVKVELGCEVAVESGKLTALLVKGSAKANLKLTLEWDRTVETP